MKLRKIIPYLDGVTSARLYLNDETKVNHSGTLSIKGINIRKEDIV